MSPEINNAVSGGKSMREGTYTVVETALRRLGSMRLCEDEGAAV